MQLKPVLIGSLMVIASSYANSQLLPASLTDALETVQKAAETVQDAADTVQEAADTVAKTADAAKDATREEKEE